MVGFVEIICVPLTQQYGLSSRLPKIFIMFPKCLLQISAIGFSKNSLLYNNLPLYIGVPIGHMNVEEDFECCSVDNKHMLAIFVEVTTEYWSYQTYCTNYTY